MDKLLIRVSASLQNTVRTCIVHILAICTYTLYLNINVNLDPRYCHVYVCGNGVTINGNSATVHFISDATHTSFHCRFRGRWMHPCEYTA